MLNLISIFQMKNLCLKTASSKTLQWNMRNFLFQRLSAAGKLPDLRMCPKNAAPTAIQKVNPVEVSYILGYPDSWMVCNGISY